MDADGASQFSDLALLETEMMRIRDEAGHGLVVGSRAHMVDTPAVVQVLSSLSLRLESFAYGWKDAAFQIT